MPDELENGVLYISINYNVAIHKCACGCGKEVVTPIAPEGWKLTYDGESISLYPSIGNWSYPCKSHYWINDNMIKWADSWSDEKIRQNRKQENKSKRKSLKQIIDKF